MPVSRRDYGRELVHPAFMKKGPRLANTVRFVRVVANLPRRPVPHFGGPTRRLVGVTRDASGNPLGGCTVQAFITSTDQFVQEVISDASGNYAFDDLGGGPFYIVAYLPGSPDVSGASVNTLVPAYP